MARMVSSPTQLPSITLMSFTPWARKYSMAPDSTPGWVVAPLSGVPAITRFGFSATEPPAGTRSMALAASSSERVIAWASPP